MEKCFADHILEYICWWKSSEFWFKSIANSPKIYHWQVSIDPDNMAAASRRYAIIGTKADLVLRIYMASPSHNDFKIAWPISYCWQWFIAGMERYRKTSNISRTLVGNNIVDNSDVVGASPVGAAPTTSPFST